MKNIVNLDIQINIKTNISLWQAIKLRIAGAEYIKEYIIQKLNDEKSSREFPSVSQVAL